MSIPVLVDLAVGEPVPLVVARTVAAAAERAGVTALRLLDAPLGIDPSVAAAYLAGRSGELGYLVDLPTTHHAPYNAARRVLSLDRAAAGRFGLVLRPGRGDEVSDAAVPDPTADPTAGDPAERWSEYAGILTRLWHSFPREALLGDQERALVVDDSLIRPISHEGRYYRVRGPIDGPSSVQGHPPVVAADVDVLGWDAVAAGADVVIVGPEQWAGAAAALTTALDRVGRPRDGIVLLGRTEVADASAAGSLAARVQDAGLDGLDLVPAVAPERIAGLLGELVPALDPASGPTLRASLGLAAVAPPLGLSVGRVSA